MSIFTFEHQDPSHRQNQLQRLLNGLADVPNQSLNPKDLLPQQLGVLEELIKSYVEDDKDGVVDRYTAPLKEGFVDPAIYFSAPRVTSCGPFALGHNWYGTHDENGQPLPPAELEVEYEWAEYHFINDHITRDDRYDATLNRIYWGFLHPHFLAKSLGQGNVVPGLIKGYKIGEGGKKLYIRAVEYIWARFFQIYPFNPIFLCGDRWSKYVFHLMERRLPGREIIPLPIPAISRRAIKCQKLVTT